MVKFGDQRIPERLWGKVEIVQDGCWRWTGGTFWNGYGQVNGPTYEVQTKSAHRLFWSLLIEDVKGRQLDHLCHDPEVCEGGKDCPHRRCVNPAHLSPTTHEDNHRSDRVNRSKIGKWHSEKTHCPQGHEYTESNTKIRQRSNGKGDYRACITCINEQARERRLKMKNSGILLDATKMEVE